ncbi:MAG: hypothetical protein M2R45_04401 [Verrucomicrobia subdivision 3 bacterium]|nr:hypothetical protein [Limisphaerales bacterium]MCS1417261.1 hypothetical protein [Limisphaerales bacterium]
MPENREHQSDLLHHPGRLRRSLVRRPPPPTRQRTCYWALEMEDRIPERSNVDYIGEYRPAFYGFGSHQKDVKPTDLELK